LFYCFYIKSFSSFVFVLLFDCFVFLLFLFHVVSLEYCNIQLQLYVDIPHWGILLLGEPINSQLISLIWPRFLILLTHERYILSTTYVRKTDYSKIILSHTEPFNFSYSLQKFWWSTTISNSIYVDSDTKVWDKEFCFRYIIVGDKEFCFRYIIVVVWLLKYEYYSLFLVSGQLFSMISNSILMSTIGIIPSSIIPSSKFHVNFSWLGPEISVSNSLAILVEYPICIANMGHLWCDF